MRARVARNVKGFNLPPSMNKEERLKFENTMVDVFEKFGLPGKYHSLTPGHKNHISDSEADKLRHKHFLFNDMTTKVALGAVVTRAPALTDFDRDPLACIASGDWVVVDNQNPGDVYAGTNRSAVTSVSRVAIAVMTGSTPKRTELKISTGRVTKPMLARKLVTIASSNDPMNAKAATITRAIM